MPFRFLLSLGALLVALLPLSLFGVPDFAQDYAAAWAWWQGRNPNGPTDTALMACCGAELARSYPAMQTAHPPLATLLALPYAVLPWPAARLAWGVTSWLALLLAWQLTRTPLGLCLATTPYWLIALILGTHEALIFVLLATALLLDGRRPWQAAVLVGLAAALKVYPGLLLLGLWLASRRREAGIALATVAVVTLLGELVLGFGVTLAWLRYVPVNTLRYVDTIDNLSLVRVVRTFWVAAPPLPVALIVAALLLLPMLPRLRRGAWLAPLVPVLLLASPLSWRHYIGLTALGVTGRIEQWLIGLCGLVTLLVGLKLFPEVETGLLVQFPLLLALLLMWYRQVSSRRNRLASSVA